MSDQLSLRLDPGLPRLPATMRPMLPTPAAEAFDSPDHLFEPTWGGARILAFVQAGQPAPVRVLDADERDLTAHLPELASLPERFSAESVLVDGELIVVDESGRCDVEALRRRLDGRPGPRVAYLLFDLLYLDGRPLLAEALFRRRNHLRRVLRPSDDVLAVPAIPADGRALHEAVTSAGLAGMTGRVRQSPYLPGVRSRLWRFVAAGQAGPGPTPRDDGTGAADDRPREPPVLALIRRLPLEDAE